VVRGPGLEAVGQPVRPAAAFPGRAEATESR